MHRTHFCIFYIRSILNISKLGKRNVSYEKENRIRDRSILNFQWIIELVIAFALVNCGYQKSTEQPLLHTNYLIRIFLHKVKCRLLLGNQ